MEGGREMGRPDAGATAELPPEIVTHILTRLPVKSLLRFRCVSKAWSALIDSPHFTKLHLRQSAKAQTNRNLVISHRRRIDFVCLDSLKFIANNEQPIISEALVPKVFDSCVGLILLHLGRLEIGLWNPSTRSYQQIPSESSVLTLPWENNEDTNCIFITFGLCYDPVIDDYKVVRMIVCHYKGTDSFASEVKVYSLKLNSWKKVQDLPYYYHCCQIHGTGVYASGALHWVLVEKLGNRDFQPFITAFDLATEEHRSVLLPDFCIQKNNKMLCLTGFEGCLCLVLIYPNCRVDVWVMKDYGVVESWSKLFSVEQLKHIREFKHVFPVAYSKNNEEILMEHDRRNLLWFNPKSNMVQDVHICGIPSSFDGPVFVCVESLVRFGTGKELHGQGKKEKTQKKIGTKRDGFLS